MCRLTSIFGFGEKQYKIALLLIFNIMVFPFSGKGQSFQVPDKDKKEKIQVEPRLESGYSLSNISGMETHNYASSFYLGFYGGFRIKNQWSLNPGILFRANMGVDKLTETDVKNLEAPVFEPSGNYRQVIRALNIPVLVRYTFGNQVYLEAGPEIGFRVQGFVEYKFGSEGIEARSKELNRNKINQTDFGFAGGIGTRILKDKAWTVGLKYYRGLVNVYKGMAGTKINSICLIVNIPFEKNAPLRKTESVE